MNSQLLYTEFPTTGQPLRVVMIGGEPWFVVADICKILGLSNPRAAARILASHDKRMVDVRDSTLISSDGTPVNPAREVYTCGNPRATATNECGLYTLVTRSRKPTARPFQTWVAQELLPVIRQGNINVGPARRRLAETFGESLSLAIPGRDERFEVSAEGAIYCPHGQMRIIAPEGKPGPYLLCPTAGAVDNGQRACRRLPLTIAMRHLLRQTAPLPQADITVNLGAAQLHGKPAHIAEVLHRLGMAGPAY